MANRTMKWLGIGVLNRMVFTQCSNIPIFQIDVGLPSIPIFHHSITPSLFRRGFELVRERQRVGDDSDLSAETIRQRRRAGVEEQLDEVGGPALFRGLHAGVVDAFVISG